ncbi:MAG: ribonuclease R [Clostridia bacterium]|nr:ribonuclease R [Clostridia bacterium]
MNFIETIYSKILLMRKNKFSFHDVAKATGLTYGFDKRTLIDTLETLVKQEKLGKLRNGDYVVLKKSQTIKCTILGTSKDYAFARPFTGEKDKDIFIAEANLNDACHGDTVLVEVGISGKDRNYKRNLPLVAKGKQEGRVVKILERGFQVVVGIMSINERGIATVIPDDRRFADSVFVSSEDINGAQNNTKVVLDILDYPSNIKMARGRVREILGDPNDVRVTTLSIIRSFNLIEEFPDDVVAEADKVSIPVSKEDQKGRKDYRDRLIITIDGDDARDFDDAISLVKDGENYRLGVYIADVSHYVRGGSKIDQEAFKRATSVYFPDHVLPMLPVSLSNGICSLNPKEDRFTMAVEMLISPAGKVLDYEIHKGIMQSSYRMTYTKVTKILNGDKKLCEEYKEIVPMLGLMAELAKILITRRDNAGNLDFDIPAPEIHLNEDGTVKEIIRKPRDISDRVIEQFMVLTNEVVARHFDKMKVPFVYRIHETPTMEKVQKFRAFAGSLGLRFQTTGSEASPKDFQTLLKLSKGQDYSTALSKVMLRSMQKARYEVQNLGHFGLALKDYCHFTSPIRRYPDLTIHRIMTEILEGRFDKKKYEFFEEFAAQSAERSSTMERQAEEAERAVDAQKMTEYMQTKIGETFEGIISGVTQNGFFVELENTIEGFVSVLRLPKGHYDYNENNYSLSGLGKVYRIGDKIEIRVVSTDIVLRRIDFELADFHREVSEDEFNRFNEDRRDDRNNDRKGSSRRNDRDDQRGRERKGSKQGRGRGSRR